MSQISNRRGLLLAAMALPALVLLLTVYSGGRSSAFQSGAPTAYSGPIAITPDDKFVWVVNPKNNSVSVLRVEGDINTKVATIRVGKEPRSVAITPNGKRAYVTNMAAGTVSVIDTVSRSVIKTIKVGTEPFGCVVSPNGKKVFVTNQSSNSLSVIGTGTNSVILTVPSIGIKPRGLAVFQDFEGGNNVYITQLIARIRNDARPAVEKEGRDDGYEGRVALYRDNPVLKTTLILNPMADTGFKSDGSTLDNIPPDGVFEFPTGAFPNLMSSIVIKGNRAYIPATGSSPNGPVRFNVNVQSLLCSLDLADNVDSNETINMNSGVQFEPVGTRLFNTNPIAVAFKKSTSEGFVVLAATNRLLRVVLDADGTPTINAPTGPGDPGGIVRVEVGKNPQGIVLNSTDTRAYVMNFISRDVSVVDIQDGSPTKFQEIDRIVSAAQPTAGTLVAIIHRGNELFNTAIGPAGTNDNALPPAGRMSDFGWGSCYSCHPDGLTDGVTWMFPDGPRQTTSMESTGEHPQPPGSKLNGNGAPLLPDFKQRVLNWSAVRDEIQDFELNIRGVSGGQGLITDGGAVGNLTPTANTGRSADLDALAAYIAMGIRAPISPFRSIASTDSVILEGRKLFDQAGCDVCHGGPNWTRSRVNFTPPPDTSGIVDGQLVAFLNKVGTFDAGAFNEKRTAGTSIVTARGTDGFNIPSLLSVFAGNPFNHNGAAQSLEAVLNNLTHRTAGSGGVDKLDTAAKRSRVAKFLRSIDAATPTFP